MHCLNEDARYCDAKHFDICEEGVGPGLLNARYYEGQRGQFLSQDPVFLAIGDPKRLSARKVMQQVLLSDPQLLNSYGYARNNPITHSDPTGEIIPAAVAYGIIWGWAMLNYEFAQYNIAAYEAETARLNPEAYSAQQIADAQQALSDQGKGAVVGFVVGELMGSPIGPAIDILGVADDARQEWYERNPEAKERPQEIIESLSSLGGASISNFMGSYNSPISSQKINSYTQQFNNALWGNNQNSGTVNIPGSPPRSANPTGYTSSGDAIYCWGVCGR